MSPDPSTFTKSLIFRLMKTARLRHCAWLCKSVQRKKKWWVKIPTKFNWEKNNEIVSPIRTTKFGNCSASSLKTARLLDVVPDFEGGRDTTRYCRTYPRGTAAIITYAAR